MYTKTVTIKKKSKLGNEFECSMTIHCDTPEEKKAKRQQKLAEFKAEKLRRELMDQYEAERALHDISMNNIFYAVEEYIENVRDFYY